MSSLEMRMERGGPLIRGGSEPALRRSIVPVRDGSANAVRLLRSSAACLGLVGGELGLPGGRGTERSEQLALHFVHPRRDAFLHVLRLVGESQPLERVDVGRRSWRTEAI